MKSDTNQPVATGTIWHCVCGRAYKKPVVTVDWLNDARAERDRLRDALRETVDLCNAMREHAPTLNLAAEKRLRDSLALIGVPLSAARLGR